MDLQVVKSPFALHWPDELGSDSWRGGPGYVVNMDAPFEREKFCAGQMHKFEPAPKGAVANKIEHPAALRAIAVASKVPPAAPAALAKPTVGGDLPPVDLPPKKAAAAK